MEKIKIDDPEYVKVLVLPENDGRFDDAEENLELKEVQVEDSDQQCRVDTQHTLVDWGNLLFPTGIAEKP
ncbi:hypothetical protein RIF29_00820 [Crotalaria pallida]|uniref:Uncharacterized protein n=1 Tax=Crotalaria pallida TaxID=3830 RepID=A0AAN9P7R1_CROPI